MTTPSALSAEEQAKAKGHRDQGARKLKFARVLAESDFVEEARPALLEAIQAFGWALAVQSRLPEPADVPSAFQAPLSLAWGEALPVLRSFAQQPASEWRSVIECLGKL